MRKYFYVTVFMVMGLLMIGYGGTAHAQSEPQVAVPFPPLVVYTDYPSQVVGVGENVSFALKLDTGTEAQIVNLDMQDLPDGWSASFKGGAHLIESTYVQPNKESTVDLKLVMPDSIEPGTYNFSVIAASDEAKSSLPLDIVVQQKLPPSLSLNVDLPTLRGKPDGTFRYTATLKNEGDEDLNVDLLAEAPAGFDVTFSSGGQDVTTLPLEANASKSISIAASPLYKLTAGSYPLTVQAQAGAVNADVALTAEVVGQSDLNLMTPDGLLSGDVRSGEDTAINLVLQNTGSSAAKTIDLTSTAPNGWTVSFDPAEIPELAADEQATVVAHVQPPDKAIAGDYVLSFKAQAKDNAIQKIDYRATVRTSTLWGISGLILIAVSVGIVGLAVSRFGRR